MESRTATFFELVRPLMPEVEARMRANPGAHHPALSAAIEHLISSGGKRIRPTVVLLTGRMLQADQGRTIILAAAIEMLHTATLVHDDLIDGATLRRGIPTLNARWTPGATVLTGDYVFARAAHLAAQTQSVPVMDSFARTLMTIVNGELTQLFGSTQTDMRADYYERIYAKTASLFELAAEGAAILSDAAPSTIDAMRTYGYNVGIAFQIVDDVLDFTGDQAAVGKPVANDLRHGLITLPTLCYHELNPQDSRIEEIISRGSLEEGQLEDLISAIRESDAVERALDEARQFISRGTQALSGVPATPEREALYDLATYVVQRTI